MQILKRNSRESRFVLKKWIDYAMRSTFICNTILLLRDSNDLWESVCASNMGCMDISWYEGNSLSREFCVFLKSYQKLLALLQMGVWVPVIFYVIQKLYMLKSGQNQNVNLGLYCNKIAFMTSKTLFKSKCNFVDANLGYKSICVVHNTFSLRHVPWIVIKLFILSMCHCMFLLAWNYVKHLIPCLQ